MGKERNKKLICGTEIIKKPDGLDEINLDLTGLNTLDNKHEFRDSDVRKAMKKLEFSTDATFFFAQTTANPLADQAIRENYKSFDIQTCSSWHFNTGMMDFLLTLIGENNQSHIYFPIVKNIRVHNLDTHQDQIYLPVIHVLKNITVTQQLEFARNVGHVVEKNFDRIKKHESPQNYDLEAFQLLMDRKISPLLLTEGPVFSGDELKKAIDWLLPYEYEVKFIRRIYED